MIYCRMPTGCAHCLHTYEGHPPRADTQFGGRRGRGSKWPPGLGGTPPLLEEAAFRLVEELAPAPEVTDGFR